MTSPIARAAASSSVIITVGCGGVGKTTIAAATALRSALEGKESLVCTIDPARRLANALGLRALGNAETEIPLQVYGEAGIAPGAPLRAMMLDMKRSWDELINRRASPETRDRIIQNRFYQTLSTSLAGSQEYVAIEKLCELRSERDYPLIVLDTPPTSHAIDFLEAPEKILDFLDNEAAKLLLAPALAAGRFGLRLFNLGGSFVARNLAKIAGTETLRELADFMQSLSGMNDSFRERAQQTRALLEAPTTSFILVSTSLPERFEETLFFLQVLRSHRMNVCAIAINRVHPPVDAKMFEAAQVLQGDLRQRVERTLNEMKHLAEFDRSGIERLTQACDPTPVVLIPRIESEIHDLKGLWELGHWLWGDRRLQLDSSITGT